MSEQPEAQPNRLNPCSCAITRDIVGHRNLIWFCPLHQAADTMLAALEDCYVMLCEQGNSNAVTDAARKAIAAAKGTGATQDQETG